MLQTSVTLKRILAESIDLYSNGFTKRDLIEAIESLIEKQMEIVNFEFEVGKQKSWSDCS